MWYVVKLWWREPLYLEELSTAVGKVPWVTLAVSDDNLVDSGEVEEGNLMTSRGMFAYCSGQVTTQLDDETKRAKNIRTKVLAIPPLCD